MSKLKKGKLPFETYYEKMISLPVVNSCTYHKPYTVAYLFVISVLKNNNLEISVMNEKEVAFINGWEAEKYRRSVK